MPPVTLKNRRLALTNSKWNVYFDHIADARGNEVHDYLVVRGHGVPDDLVTGVAILPVLDGRIVMLRSYRHPVQSEIWEVPRGFVDAGEPPLDAALRELSEETSLRCARDHVVPLGFYLPDPGTMAARCALFVATRCEGTPRLSGDEIGLDGLEVMDAASMAQLVARGGIEDAGSLIAYYRYLALS